MREAVQPWARIDVLRDGPPFPLAGGGVLGAGEGVRGSVHGLSRYGPRHFPPSFKASYTLLDHLWNTTSGLPVTVAVLKRLYEALSAGTVEVYECGERVLPWSSEGKRV
jgi:hypothetical protein